MPVKQKMNNKQTHDKIEILEEKLQKSIEKQEKMKRVNSYYRKHKTLEGCNEVSEVVLEKIRKRLLLPKGKPYSDEMLRINRGRIKEYESKLKFAKAFRDAGDGWTFNGGRIEIDREKRYIRLYDSTSETRRRIRELDFVFYSRAPAGTPQMFYFEHLLSELLEMTRKYDELYER